MTETASTHENRTHDDIGVEEGTATEGNGTMVNIVHYQSALVRANRTQGLSNDQVKGLAPATRPSS